MILKRFILSISLILLLSNCGKHEATDGVVGAAAGAAVGSAVSNKKNKGTGTLVGALIGNYFGRKVGKEVDKQENVEKVEQQGEIKRLRAENKYLKKVNEKWCFHCNKKINLLGANSCPYCGSRLITEKYCKGCAVSFEPNCDYEFCPYCEKRIFLSFR